MQEQTRETIKRLLRSPDSEMKDLAVSLFCGLKKRTWMEIQWMIKDIPKAEREKLKPYIQRMAKCIK